MKLTLIGAGPGDPELITLKAIKALAGADVILYDALANRQLLDYAQPQAEIIYVGKRMGRHSVSQTEINRIIVENGLAGKHVVRLKGGDPVVFGRGFEEMEYAASFGIETVLIPGISSSIAAPALAGVPVTRRGVSESFWVLTGHTKDGKLPQDIHLAARSQATIVILMGMSLLNEICAVFSGHGKSEVPVGIIENGSRPEQRLVISTIDRIYKEVQQKGIRNPAVIVIGEVVRTASEELIAKVSPFTCSAS